MHIAGTAYQTIRIGCAGWSIPKQAAPHFVIGDSHLQRYSSVFNRCEINSSFYHPHKPTTWQRWAASVPAGFRFSVKAPRAITHEAKLNCGKEMLSTFLGQIGLLGEKLGPVLVQLPPSLEFHEAQARGFFSLLRGMHSGDVVVEPRNKSWFTGNVERLLQEFHVARVAADPACVPSAAQPGGCSRLAYFRLHGSPRLYYSAYTSAFLDRLSAQSMPCPRDSSVVCIRQYGRRTRDRKCAQCSGEHSEGDCNLCWTALREHEDFVPRTLTGANNPRKPPSLLTVT
jgi:uncharacterized protein YecE (DUF72 family)